MRKVFLAMLMIAAITTVSAQSKWTYKLGFGGELKSGNVNTTIFNTNGGIERNDSTLAFDANAAYVYGMKSGDLFENNFTANLKFDFWQYGRWSPFVSASYKIDTIRGFDYRINFLAGVKYRIFWNANCDYSISGAYVYEYTQYHNLSVDDPLYNAGPSVNRISLRFKAKQKIANNVSIKHTTFYTPCITNFSDYGISSVTSLSTQINKHFSFDINFNYEYHSVVPVGVQNTDIITSATLNLKF